MVASEVVHGGAPLVETEDGCHHSVHEPESQQGGAMPPPSHFYRLSSSNAVVNPYYHRIEGRKQSRSSLVMSAAAEVVRLSAGSLARAGSACLVREILQDLRPSYLPTLSPCLSDSHNG